MSAALQSGINVRRLVAGKMPTVHNAGSIPALIRIYDKPMKILPGSSEREFILHFEDLPEYESCFQRAEKDGYFDIPGSVLPSECTLIARTEGNQRSRRIKPVQILAQNEVQRIYIQKTPEPVMPAARPEEHPADADADRPSAPQEAAGAVAEEKPAAEPPEKWESVADRVHKMPTTEKVHLALRADFQERRALMQENNPKIQEFLLRNPRLTEPEIAWLAKNPMSSVHTVMTILQNKAWMSIDAVRSGVLTNPKTPPQILSDMIPRLSAGDLIRMNQSRVLREDLRAAVQREAKKRGLRFKTQD